MTVQIEDITPSTVDVTDQVLVRRSLGPLDYTIQLVPWPTGGGATNLAYDAATRVVSSDTGTDATLTVADGTNAGLMTSANFTKLAGVATGATANSPDATLLARANHTGTQAAATITGLAAIATSGSASDLGAGTLPAARFDDTAHGARAGGTLHANAVAAGAAGFMTGADKTKLDGIAAGAQVNVATDLAYTAATRLLASSTGADVTLPLVVASGDAGLLTGADKAKLDGIASGAQVNVPTNLTYTAATRVIASDTGTDVTLPLVTSGDAGLAPASGGGTTNFLRADGTWAAPSGGGGGASPIISWVI